MVASVPMGNKTDAQWKVRCAMAESFGQRVRTLLGKTNWNQTTLSAEAEIPPPTVSKLLSGAAPSQAQVLAIARALKTTAVELTFGTDAQEIIEEWVPRAQLEAEAEARLAAQQEAVRLTTRLEEAHARVQSLEATADRLRQERAKSESEVQSLKADLAAQVKRSEGLERGRAEALLDVRTMELERVGANQRIQRLTAQLAATQGEMVKKAVITGVLSFVGGALATRTPSSRSTRAPRPTTQVRRRKR